MDKKANPEEFNASTQLPDHFAGLTFGSVLSALSNGSSARRESSIDPTASSIIADKTLQLERRLRAAEAEISQLKNINQLQKDRIDSLESELEANKRVGLNEKSDSKSNIPSIPTVYIGKHSLPRTSRSSDTHSDEFARDLQTYYETRCRNLEKMVLEMHRWFSDYDLVWVGEKDGDEARALTELTDEQLEESEARNAHLNLETLISAFPNGDDDDDDEGENIYEDDDSTPSLDLFWFSNGLKISSYPLMRYDDDTWGRQTLEEIAEGFLPSRLQFDFPNGVDLKSYDRRRFTFDDTKEGNYPSVRELRARGLLPSTDHPGLAETAGKKGTGFGRISSLKSKSGGKVDFQPSVWSHGSRVRQKSPASRYLDKIPKLVIDKDGDIRHPREGLQKVLTGHSTGESTKSFASRVIPVRIRVYHRRDDKQVLRVHLRPHQTIDELKRLCENKLSLRDGGFDDCYELVSDIDMREYEMSESELTSSSLKVWVGEMTVGDAGWLRSGIDDDAPIKDKLVCLHVRRKL